MSATESAVLSVSSASSVHIKISGSEINHLDHHDENSDSIQPLEITSKIDQKNQETNHLEDHGNDKERSKDNPHEQKDEKLSLNPTTLNTVNAINNTNPTISSALSSSSGLSTSHTQIERPTPNWCPCLILRTLLLGTHPKNSKSGLRHLRGQTKTILLTIYTMCQRMGSPYFIKGSFADVKDHQRQLFAHSFDSLYTLYPPDEVPTNIPESFLFPIKRDLEFPKPMNIQVNMMPFILFRESTTLPSILHEYIPMIRRCGAWDNHSKMCYLTVSESRVKKGECHRRPGLHVESIPIITQHGGGDSKVHFINWGAGVMMSVNQLSGGIYMASNVANSTKVWDCKLDKEVPNGVGPLGNMEHLRYSLPCKGYSVPANELIWMTDMTPHESVPVREDCYRQYFRLVTSNISIWYSKHNTPNPLLQKLSIEFPPHVKITKEDKFKMMEKMSKQLAKEMEKRRKNQAKQSKNAVKSMESDEKKVADNRILLHGKTIGSDGKSANSNCVLQ